MKIETQKPFIGPRKGKKSVKGGRTKTAAEARSQEHCISPAEDPFCFSEECGCGKPVRLLLNWRRNPYDGAITKIKPMTKSQADALEKLAAFMHGKRLSELIDVVALKRSVHASARELLRLNGFKTRGLSGAECLSLSLQFTTTAFGGGARQLFFDSSDSSD